MDSPKISVVIPHVPNIGADEYLNNLVEQLDNQVDEVYVIENSGIGFGAACNLGLAAAVVDNDFIIVSNNDIKILQGDLKNLCIKDGVGVPNIHPRPKDWEPRCFYCMDRSVYYKILEDDYYFYDEQFFPGYFEDDDIIERMLVAEIFPMKVNSVKIEHFGGGGFTMKQFSEQESYDANRERFNKKWNSETPR